MKRRGEVDGSTIVSVAIVMIVCAAVGGMVFGAFMRGTAAKEEQRSPEGTSSSEYRPELPRGGANSESAAPTVPRVDYVGLQANDLISDFGTPTQRYSNNDGTTVWFYQWEDQWAEFRVNTAGYVVTQRREAGQRI